MNVQGINVRRTANRFVDAIIDQHETDPEGLIVALCGLAGIRDEHDQPMVLESSGGFWAVRLGDAVRCGTDDEARAVVSGWRS